MDKSPKSDAMALAGSVTSSVTAGSPESHAVISHQQSPISVSVSNSDTNTPLMSPRVGSNAVSIPTTLSQVNNVATPQLPGNLVLESVITASIDQMMENDDEAMDVDNRTTSNRTDMIAMENTDKEGMRLAKVAEINEKIENLDTTRLELVPLLLDVIEHVKSGEIAIKDVDNACSRIRLRLNKLQEGRAVVEQQLSEMQTTFPANEQLSEHIATKEASISDIADKIRRFCGPPV